VRANAQRVLDLGAFGLWVFRMGMCDLYVQVYFIFIKKIFFVVLVFELRTYTLSFSTSPFFVLCIFETGSLELFPRLALNRDPPDLCLLSTWDYRCEPPHLACKSSFSIASSDYMCLGQ
jgi:hypothetical protein